MRRTARRQLAPIKNGAGRRPVSVGGRIWHVEGALWWLVGKGEAPEQLWGHLGGIFGRAAGYDGFGPKPPRVGCLRSDFQILV